ncbi:MULTISPECIES: hypothetical protein [Thalassospira]|uniref:hypothetical protein n=1 Tax=Thalassospira TaxID=168934 RepID=UPI0008289D71|nr:MULTISPECIES: hypothetical protein [Thalassospira]OCK10331.1 hypothetical protein KO164_0036 [Thalassospira sp. KO164]SEC86345.1 hypothetical protein SAMN04515623_0035 [Thalassospira permensis]
MSNTFKSLRLANEARQAEWDSGEQISLAFRGNELAGEVGEHWNTLSAPAFVDCDR